MLRASQLGVNPFELDTRVSAMNYNKQRKPFELQVWKGTGEGRQLLSVYGYDSHGGATLAELQFWTPVHLCEFFDGTADRDSNGQFLPPARRPGYCTTDKACIYKTPQLRCAYRGTAGIYYCVPDTHLTADVKRKRKNPGLIATIGYLLHRRHDDEMGC